ncbi:Holliday junction resolvase RuvX [Clostridium sediminicola]|uniref:Holliday junction resolvase RuvX n=1 Tax=Clostridium sediminicola TaxID=3114879 RepID=UPI0031F20396
MEITRILGLDIGNQTIGVSISDPLGLTAQGIKTIRRTKIEKDLEELEFIIRDYGAQKIVCGLPKNMNGTIGSQGEKALEFSEILEEKFNLEIIMWDERLTTVAAKKAMLEANMSRKKRKKVIDKVASTFILQSYLDSL